MRQPISIDMVFSTPITDVIAISRQQDSPSLQSSCCQRRNGFVCHQDGCLWFVVRNEAKLLSIQVLMKMPLKGYHERNGEVLAARDKDSEESYVMG